MSKLGLRTLILAKKELSDEEVESWLAIHHAASTSDDRKARLEQAANRIERDLEFIAATG